MAEEEQEEVVTMPEVLERQKELEALEAEVPVGDPDHCTYPKGSIAQSLFSCKTCAEKYGQVVALCYACAHKCHEKHTLYEPLYEKHGLRCDCGNDRQPDFTCSLYPDKEPNNPANTYNHNFRGGYCRCGEGHDGEQLMAQCLVCEEWFHDACMDVQIADPAEKPDEADLDMMCRTCLTRFPLFRLYPELVHPAIRQNEEEDEEEPTKGKPVAEPINASEDKGGKEEEEKKEKSACIIRGRVVPNTPAIDTFLKKEWRQRLCSCPSCLEMYAKSGLPSWVLEKKEAREEEGTTKGQKRPLSLYEEGLEALKQLPRSEQLEMIYGFNEMASDLRSFLAEKAAAGTVVTKEDIQAYFTRLQDEKRRKKDQV